MAEQNYDILPIPTDGLTLFQYRLAMLDAFLTRADWRQCVQTAQQREATPDNMTWNFERSGHLDHAYYLSDGGYSRICASYEDGHLFLTSNSSDRVKANWEYCPEMIADIERDTREYLESFA